MTYDNKNTMSPMEEIPTVAAEDLSSVNHLVNEAYEITELMERLRNRSIEPKVTVGSVTLELPEWDKKLLLKNRYEQIARQLKTHGFTLEVPARF